LQHDKPSRMGELNRMDERRALPVCVSALWT
jgi:hypothetical protein